MTPISKLRRFVSPRQKIKLRRLLLEGLETRRVMATTPIITEILASNSDGLKDADGDSSDWIEIYNPTTASVNLSGWHLTDNASDLNEWTFPSVNLDPNQYLTVFASGKNRAVAGQELHTNFSLSAGGEFLALTNTSGTIVSQFAPSYPAQATNVSYGTRFDTQTYLTTGSNAKTLIPTSDALGATWQQPGFNDSTWQSTPVGVGYGVVEPGFDVNYYEANIDINDINTALGVIANPSQQVVHASERTQFINYLANGSDGHYTANNPFPTQEIGDDIDDFLIRATSTITIPTSGNWTFGANSDDGYRLTLSRNGVDYVSEFNGLRAAEDTLTTFNLPAGQYTATLVMFERGGGASVELFAAQGSFGGFDSNAFHLVGDEANGGLTAQIPVAAGPDSPLRSDIRNSMLNVNATAYIRVPFTYSTAAPVDTLTLAMRYDDGFVAYLNGVEVARRNAPNTLAYNSSALTDRTTEQSLVTESIDISAFRSALVNGNNVLAIRGLNSMASDTSFLMLPQLSGSKLYENDLRFFPTPTPGAPNQGASLGIIDQPTFSVPAGFYDAPISVALNSTAGQNATIFYTLDGSDPTPTNGLVYSSPIAVSKTTNIRAVTYRAGYISLPSVTGSYLFLDDIIHQSPNGETPAGWPSSWGNNVVDYGMDPQVLSLEGETAVKNALLAIPSLSITTTLSNLFDPATGIYANAYNQGSNWERPASLELINPDGTPGFQIDAGLRVRGGYSRSSDNPKHSFRLFFRGEYGDSTLDYPIAGPDATGSFKKIDLRTAQNYSWSFGGDPSNNFVTDVFNRLSQQAMGQPSTSSQWYHLYINGEYWGLYQTQERSEAEFAASYFGGVASNYDVIKAESGPYTIFATDGNLDAWYSLWTQINANSVSGLPTVADNSVYYGLQGKNPDGTDNPNLPVLLDVDNLAVYMIGILYGGNLDAPISNFLNNQAVNNFYAVRDRTGREGFKFFLHDSEHTLRDVNENRNGPWPAGADFQYSNPQWFHQRLMTNAEYRMRFADLVEKYFFYDGALSVGANQARFSSEAAKIDQAVIAESVRWGDAKRPDSPLTRQDWLNAVNGVLTNYFPLRNAIVINQFRNTTWNGTTRTPLFPSLDAPSFLVNNINQHGGTIQPGSSLRFGSSTGTVYYTTDGSDPRLIGGGISSKASSYAVSTTTQTIFGQNSQWKYRDTGVDLGSAWSATNFNDSAWSSGFGELGYGDGDEGTVLSYGPDPNNKYTTTYFRKTFNVTDVSQITSLLLSLKRDDGAVVYINGVEVVRSNMPTGAINASTLAAVAIGGADEATFYPFQIPVSLLVNGNNTIAVEIHQSAGNSSDISFDASLTATRQTSAAIPMGLDPKTYMARTLSPGGEWSALEQASFSVPLTPASADNLRVTELQYNPRPFTGPNATQAPFNDAQNFEFIELQNTSDETILLDGVTFTGISYTFPTSPSGPSNWLLPGQIIVVVKNQIAFAARYQQPGSPYEHILVAPGDYGTSNLNNGGEAITVTAANGDEIQSFTYDDSTPWVTSPDGSGPSLTVIYTNPSSYNNASNWRASFAPDGTPGIDENDAPTDVNIDNIFVPENQAGALIGTLSTSDPDFIDTFTYEIAPGGDGNLFVIQGNKLYVGSTAFDYETKQGYYVYVKSTDAGGQSVTTKFTIGVTDTNDAPTASAGGPYTIGEGQSLQLTGTASDQDAGQTLTYQWDYNYNGVTFDVDATGLTPTTSFPDQGSRTIALRVTDNANPAASTIATTTVTITNRNPGLTRTNAAVTSTVLTPLTNTGTWSDVPADTVSLSASLGAITKNSNGTWSWTYTPSAKLSAQVVTITASDEDGGSSQVTFTITADAAVSTASVYYTNSGYSALGVAQAIDTGRTVLRASSTAQTTSAANITNYTRGLNGLVLDIPGLANTNLTAADFIFRFAPPGASGVVNPSTWAAAAAPTLVNVTAGNSTTAARVRLEWANNAIQNTWLQVIVKSNTNTGLTAPAVFYLGNSIGEVTGGNPYRITVADRSVVAAAVSASVVPVTDMRDIDKSRRITVADVTTITPLISAVAVLRDITVPASGSAQEGADTSLGLLGSLILNPTTATAASTTSSSASATKAATLPTVTTQATSARNTDTALQALQYPSSNATTSTNSLLATLQDFDVAASVKKQTKSL